MAQAFDASAQQALLIQRAESALAMAKRMGADAAEVGASVDQGIGVSVREGKWKRLSFPAIRVLPLPSM